MIGFRKDVMILSDYQHIINDADRLRKYISDMCTTNNLSELSHLYNAAEITLNELMLENGKRIRDKEDK